MGICEIGEKKEIGGEWYQKSIATNICIGCAFAKSKARDSSMQCQNGGIPSWESIEDGGKDCADTIWVACDPPAKTKPAKPAPKAKWAPYAPALSIKETKRSLYLKLEEMVATINNLGAENARLKNQLAKGKAK